jgi:8-oxo-dGTP diphosphatase
MPNNIPTHVTAVDINGNKHKVPLDELRWRPSAYGIVIKDDHLLVVRQKTGYDLPGGGVEIGETSEQAVLREIKEESGIEAANPRIAATHTNYFKLPRQGTVVQSLMLYYVCDYQGGDFSETSFDEWEVMHVIEPEWYPLDKLDGLKVASSNDFRKYVRQLVS